MAYFLHVILRNAFRKTACVCRIFLLAKPELKEINCLTEHQKMLRKNTLFQSDICHWDRHLTGIIFKTEHVCFGSGTEFSAMFAWSMSVGLGT